MLVTALAAAGALFAVHYYVLHELLGLLAVDETYFAHIFWLMRQGQQPYVDFASNHLPTYFNLLLPILPAGAPTDLSFVWVLRATGLVAVIAYVAMLWSLARRDTLVLLPFLLLFVVLGRMSEIRPDTIGLLLFNAGWWLLIRDTGRRNVLITAALAGVALTFSARAAVMAVGLGALMAFLCWQRRDLRTFLWLIGFAVIFAALVGLIYLVDPASFGRMVDSVYLDPLSLMNHVPVTQRLFAIDRLLLVMMIVAALLSAVRHRNLVILFACATQLALILVDPSPYQYVYGWAAIPTLAGLLLFKSPNLRPMLAATSAGLAAIVLLLANIGNTPAPGSLFRVTYDRPFESGVLSRASTAELMRLVTTSERQQGAWNQLALFAEVCRRVDAPVLTRYHTNLLCLPDARYDWAGLRWPAMFEGDTTTQPQAEFEQLFAERPPALVAWGKQHWVPTLNPWGRALLADYDLYPGYALRKSR